MHFPSVPTTADPINCCEIGVDCFDFLYETEGIFKICPDECTTCDENSNCVTCYNEKELNKYSNYKSDIQALKSTVTPDYYWNYDKSQCINTCSNCWLDKDEGIFMPCYHSCRTCNGKGNSSHHNCFSCDVNKGYYHVDTPSSENCKLESEVGNGYYLNNQNSNQLLHFFERCSSVCFRCNGNGNNQCTKCATNTFQKYEEISYTTFECFAQKPDGYFFYETSTGKYYKKCSANCATCDKDEADGFQNCLSCKNGYKLFNRNCTKHCPTSHKEFQGEICVLECPAYTIEKLANDTGEDFYKCQNCKEDTNGEKCVYLGSRHNLNTKECVACKSLSQTFEADSNYGILDDCYELCQTCSQRGTETLMHCDSCYDNNPEHCLVKDSNNGNCVAPGTHMDYYYETTEIDSSFNEKCVFKNCYETCKTCDYGGNILTHNCTLCKDGYQFDPVNTGNCVSMCPYYWYIDSSTNAFTCTTEAKCPDDKPYFVEINQGCVEECSAAIHNSQRYFYRYKKTCITQCPQNSMRDDLLYVCHSLDDEKDVFVYMSNYIKQGITSANNLMLYSSDGNKLFHLFNTTELGLKTYRSGSYSVGTSIIDLTNCINTLKNIKGFSSSEVLYVGVLDIFRDDTSAPQFEYTIFDHSGNKLDIKLKKV